MKSIPRKDELQGRIEQRMAAMKLAGSEVHQDFSDSFREMTEEESLEHRLKDRMMEQMQTSWEDIEVSDKGLGFDDLSLEQYRQDLLDEYSRDKMKFQRMPKGVYSGFKAHKNICPDNGIIALLGYPSRPANVETHEYKVFDLIYINYKGEKVFLNQKEVLDAITYYKDSDRYVPESIDKGNEEEIQSLVRALKTFLDNQAAEVEEQENGNTKKTMGKEAKDVLSKLSKGDKSAVERVKENVKVSEKYKLENFDLITWFLVTV